MDQLRDALIKAGLISNMSGGEAQKISKKRNKIKYSEWRRGAYKNRFGTPANYEIWLLDKLPSNWADRCGMCGKSLFDKVTWQAHHSLTVNICPACYIYGRKHDPDRFPPLEKECPSQSQT